MAKRELQVLVAEQMILSRIHAIRSEKVILDQDLAEMYGVETKHLKRQVKRNKDRFPKDFMFEFTKKEYENLRSQMGTSRWGGTTIFRKLYGLLGAGTVTDAAGRHIHVAEIEGKDLIFDEKGGFLKEN